MDSNEYEWGFDKSSSDYELYETFREPGEPIEEEIFKTKFRVGQSTLNKEEKDTLLDPTTSKSLSLESKA